MMTSYSAVLLALAPPPAGQQQGTGSVLWNMVPLLLVMVFLYFAMIAPQRKRAKQHEEMLKTLKSGDRVATSSGIVGTIVSVKDRTVSLRSDDSKLEVVKSSVTEVLERKADTSEAKS
ncbi:MAG: hypothetical protein RJA22_376 [Verrucomicrobiota bacterium]|jgi:preprotein translocase subunit YajC